MKLTVLGNNGPFPSGGGACSSYLVGYNGLKILMDAGSGSLSNLMKLINPEEIDAIVLSHLHWDHMTDIPVLFYYFHVMAANGREFRKIPLYCPGSPSAAFNIIKGFNRFDVNVLDGESRIILGDLVMTAERMTHPVESYAIKVSGGGRTLVYTGDTTLNPQIKTFAAGCDLLIADSAFLDEQMGPGSPHMSAAQCAGIASEAGAGRLMLSHLNPYTNPEEYLNEAKKIFNDAFLSRIMVTTEV